jgi:hypothetical protein
LPGWEGWVGLEGGKGLRKKGKGFSLFFEKGFQTIEFQQPKEMLQHVCNN